MRPKLQRINFCLVVLLLSACTPRVETQTGIPPLPSASPAVQTVQATHPQAAETQAEASSLPTEPSAAYPTRTIPPEAIQAIDAWLTEESTSGDFTGSVLVAQDGIALLSKGYGLADRAQGIPNTPQTRFRLGSVTKQFTATAILILQQQGKLNVQDPICMYLDNCPEIWQAITIHHLLTHSSGIVNFTSLANYRRLMATPVTPEQNMANFKDLLLEFPPGTRYHYSNSGYIVLGNIIERAAGMSYEAFLQQAIFTPLGMQNTGYEHPDSGVAVGYQRRETEKPADFIDMSVPFSAGALYSTLEDLLLWDQALYTEKLLPQAAREAMFTEYVELPGEEAGYGYGWIVKGEGDSKLVQHGGGINGFRSLIVRYLGDRILVVILSNQENASIEEVWNTVKANLFGDS